MRSYITLSKQSYSNKMSVDDNNYEVIFCAEDDDYTVYCGICDKLCNERYYKKSFELRNSRS